MESPPEKKPFLFGISGNAGAGKDTICKILLKKLGDLGIKSSRAALADNLKKDISPFLFERYGVDVFNCTPEEKERIRPELVAYGKERREQTKGTYWTKSLEREWFPKGYDVLIITDIRYDLYKEDEYTWLTGHGGVLLYVERYEVISQEDEMSSSKELRKYVPPANRDEEVNNKILKDKAFIKINWQTIDFSKPLPEEYERMFDMIVAGIVNQVRGK